MIILIPGASEIADDARLVNIQLVIDKHGGCDMRVLEMGRGCQVTRDRGGFILQG